MLEIPGSSAPLATSPWILGVDDFLIGSHSFPLPSHGVGCSFLTPTLRMNKNDRVDLGNDSAAVMQGRQNAILEIQAGPTLDTAIPR